MVVEAVVAIGSGIAARSVALTAFGVDSAIEMISAALLLWRLRAEAGARDLTRVEHVERRATWASAILLALLCLYVVGSVAYALSARVEPEGSVLGIAISLAALVIMPLLARAKRRTAGRLESAALRADAAGSLTCAYLAGATLGGLALNALLGWWWADYVAAAALLCWLVGETREVFEAASSGETARADDDRR